MKRYSVQRLQIEFPNVDSNGNEKLLFCDPFPWWDEDTKNEFHHVENEGKNQDHFWKDLKYSNWHEFDHSEGVWGGNDLSEILEYIFNLYHKNGYSLVSQSTGVTFNFGVFVKGQDEHAVPNGQELILVFKKD